MWAEINGERKKVACGPCIRGHRSSKCDHRDRVLIEVRKPGRPLSSCPHPTGSCGCERVVINYTIPKSSECGCPSEQERPAAPATVASNRVQKSRPRKSSIKPASLEKAIKASQDAETDSSSFFTQTPTNPSIAASEKSVSNSTSPPSSASSTPRLLPSPSRKESLSADARSADNSPSLPTPPLSSCCQPKAARQEIDVAVPKQGGSCCASKPKEVPEPESIPAQKKSCCGGPSPSPQLDIYAPPKGQLNVTPNFAQFGPFQQQAPQFQGQTLGYLYSNPGLNYNMPVNAGMGIPFAFNTPIYNHMASGFQHPQDQHFQGAAHAGHQGAEHNCHCGDGCSCFGCAAHPNNATMTEYIRVMHQYMSTGGFGTLPPPSYDIPSYPHQAGFGAEAAPTVNFNDPLPPGPFNAYNASQVGFQPSMNVAMSMAESPLNASSSWQNSSSTPRPHSHLLSSEHETQSFKFQDSVAETKVEYSTPSPIVTDSPSEGKDEDAPTLSPSSYFWSEMVLPGCSDETGTCQCDDGCECVGCLVHGGHNGVPLSSSSVNEEQPFENFVANNDLRVNDGTVATNLFSDGPT